MCPSSVRHPSTVEGCRTDDGHMAVHYWLRQLRRVRRSLDDETAAILVYAFVTSRVVYCNLLLARAPKSVADKLQRVMNAAPRAVSAARRSTTTA